MNHKPALWNRDFLAACFSSFFLFMTFYILAVTLPIFVTDTLRGGQQQVGLVMTSFIIAAVIFRPLSGKWLDEFDRRKIVFFALALFAGSTLVYMVVENFYMLLALRFLHGIGFGMAATATGAIVADLIPESRKGEGIGYFSLFMSLAMVIGPFLGLTITEYTASNGVLFGVCLLLAALSFACGMLIRIPKRVPAAAADKKVAATGWKRYIEPRAVPISLTGSILAFSYGSITTFLSVYAKDLGIGAYASYFFMVFALVIVVTRPFTGKLFDRLGEHVLIYPGILCFTVGMIALSQVETPIPFLLTGALLGLGFGALLPSFQTIAIKASPRERSGLATGTFFLLFDSGYGIGSYVLGIVAAQSDYHTMYLVSGVVVACAAVVYFALHRPRLVQAR